LYFRKPLNLDNGFVLSFNLDVSYKKYEGFAVVLSKNPFGPKGADGDGLGYAGKKNTLAIEFDNKYSASKHDP
jgi:hypothetical protein